MKKAELRKRNHHDTLANGVVQIKGQFYKKHRDEVRHLVHLTVKMIQATHPMEKILNEEENGHGWTLEVSSAKLAERLGRTVQKSFGGETSYGILHDSEQARVTWERNEPSKAEKSVVKSRPRKRGRKRAA